jgi:hypothetical protein
MMVFVIQCFEPEAKGLLVKCMVVVWGGTALCLISCPCYNTVRASDEKTPIEATNFSWSLQCSPPSSLQHIRFTRSCHSCIVGNGTDGSRSEKRLLPPNCWSYQTMRIPVRTVKYAAVLWQLQPFCLLLPIPKRKFSFTSKLMWWEVTFSIKPSEIMWHYYIPGYYIIRLRNTLLVNYFIFRMSLIHVSAFYRTIIRQFWHNVLRD